MPVLHQCPGGHTWELPDDAPETPCPVCSTQTEHPILRLDPASTPRETSRSGDRTLSVHRDRTVEIEPPEPTPPTTFGDLHTIAIPVALVDASGQDRVTVEIPLDPLTEPGTIPGYEIVGELGRGGTGVVYLARNAEGTPVAIKMLRSAAGITEAERQRFLLEARAIAELHHDNIVEVLAVGEARGQPYFALEYVGGGTLANFLSKRRLNAHETGRLIALLARAMQRAHDRGVVHCDLKPANVLLTNADTNQPWPKIADFGLALQLDTDDRSRSGWILGTPAYMAPEQAAGKSGAIGPAADVWALGAILYECLTGRPPFQGSTALETLNQVQKGELVPPSKTHPNVPRDLETICLKCLRKNPTRRYASMEELASDLERFERGEPVLARPPGLMERFGAWIARYPTLVAMLLVCVVMSVFMVGILGYYSAWLKENLAQMARINSDLETERNQGVRNQNQLEARSKLLQEYRYAADIQLAQRLWAVSDLPAFRETLDPYLSNPERKLDFACRYLEKLPHGDLATLSGHREDIYSLVWSPDGDTLASGGKDGHLCIWNMPAGTMRFRIDAHKEEINSVAFSPTGRLVATGSDDGRIGLWNAGDGNREGYLPSRGSKVVSLIFSADGKSLFGGLDSGELVRWSVERTVEEKSIAGVGSRIEQIARSLDGRWLALAAGSSGVVLYDTTGETVAHQWKLKGVKALSVAFSPSGESLAVGTNPGLVTWLDLATRKEIDTLVGHTERVTGVEFIPNHELLISSGQDGVIALWNLSGKPKREGTLLGHLGRVWAIAVSPDGRTVASGGQDGLIKLWRPVPQNGYESLRTRGPNFRAMATVPGTPLIALAGSQGVELLSDSTTDRPGTVLFAGERIHAVAVSPERKFVLAATANDRVLLHDCAAGADRVLLENTPVSRGLAFSTDGRLAAVGDAAGKLHLWELPEVRKLPVVTLQTDDPILTLAFQPKTQRLAVGFRYGRIGLWEAKASSCWAVWQAHQGTVERISFDDTGTLLASAGGDRCARLWNLSQAEPQEIHRGLLGHSRPVTDVIFSPNGRNVVTGSLDGTVRVWSMATGCEMLNFERLGPVRGVGFLDANRLIVGSSDANDKFGSVRMFVASPQ